MEDFKNRCHVFLQDESNISKYLPNFENKPAKHIIKYVHFEPFKFDILELKKDINKNIDKEDNVVMFVYDDKKIFEKSKAYRVSIQEVSMKFKIEKHILKKAEELSFITIKHDSEFKVEGYTIPKEGYKYL